ncbi:hypothetical protein [Vibrio owensii]|uniref:hypothetical protein n=1 Tax=Vibrio owensii TaxID=696485 RepID=UPI0003A527ED|nr:hypothetical protein [Vibrio owensii]
MNKKILFTLIAGVMSSSAAFADAPVWSDAPTDGAKDSASAAIEFVAKVPTILAGKWITFTGEAGGAMKAGQFEVAADGQFATVKPVVLELHWYDEATATTGDLIDMAGDEIEMDDGTGTGTMTPGGMNSLTYTVSKVDFAANDPATDTSTAEATVRLDGNPIATDMPIDAASLTNPSVTTWEIANTSAATVFGHIVAGDEISAKTTVMADASFAIK